MRGGGQLGQGSGGLGRELGGELRVGDEQSKGTIEEERTHNSAGIVVLFI